MCIFNKLSIHICEEDCIGDSACVNAAPETFELNDDIIAVLTKESSDTLEDIMAAAEACPLDIITVIDKETGKQLYPLP